MANPSEFDAAPTRKLSNLALLWRFVRQYPNHLVFALLSLMVAAGATIAIPQGFKLIVDHGFRAGSDPAAIAPYFWTLLGIVGVMGAATAVRFYFVSWIGERVVADLRRAVHAHLLTLDPAFFEENRPSEIASRLTSDTAVIEQVVSTSASVALRNVFMGIGGIAYMAIQSLKLTGLMLLVIPMTILPIVLLGRRVRTMSRTSQDRIANVGSIVAEVLGAIKVVQAFTQEPREAGPLRGRSRGRVQRRQAPHRRPRRHDGGRHHANLRGDHAGPLGRRDRRHRRHHDRRHDHRLRARRRPCRGCVRGADRGLRRLHARRRCLGPGPRAARRDPRHPRAREPGRAAGAGRPPQPRARHLPLPDQA